MHGHPLLTRDGSSMCILELKHCLAILLVQHGAHKAKPHRSYLLSSRTIRCHVLHAF